MKYKSYALKQLRQIPPIQQFAKQDIAAMETVANVLPFKVNNYVIEQLIDWNNIPEDPIFQLCFPQKEMLTAEHFSEMASALRAGYSKSELKLVANKIRYQLNPHPANQQSNVPSFEEKPLRGIQHKYRETALFFPAASQTCHAYCTFCFRWPQFTGIQELKFAMKESETLYRYIQSKPQLSDLLFTGGDPLIMSAKKLRAYLQPFLDEKIPHLKTIRIGTKALSYWPYRFLSDQDSDDLLRLFEEILQKGYHLSLMAHFNHAVELQTTAAEQAISRIRSTGAVIRCQSPIMQHINDSVECWRDMTQRQVELGCMPYYLFVARDTGAQDYFAVPLARALQIYQAAYRQLSGLGRTLRGPSMSAHPGKVQITGISQINDEKVFVLQFIQARNPNWVGRPFFAKFDPQALWLDELAPALGAEHFFFEKEMLMIDY